VLTVSVVIPVKNDAALLRVCLAALAAQTRKPDEIIVVDNASSDDSAEVARLSGACVVREERPGIAAAASTGYDAASEDIIVRCDADSVPPTDWIERIVEAFENPRLEALTGPGEFPDLGRVGQRLARMLYTEAYFVLLGLLLGQSPLFGSNAAMRATTWRRVRDSVHRDDPNVHDDLDLSIQLAPGTIRLDRSLGVPVSSRPFTGLRSMVLRGWRGQHTLWVNRGRLHPIRRRLAYTAPTKGTLPTQ
jgi:glycosyltransferase involved in cell wall biosynthesis